MIRIVIVMMASPIVVISIIGRISPGIIRTVPSVVSERIIRAVPAQSPRAVIAIIAVISSVIPGIVEKWIVIKRIIHKSAGVIRTIEIRAVETVNPVGIINFIRIVVVIDHIINISFIFINGCI